MTEFTKGQRVRNRQSDVVYEVVIGDEDNHGQIVLATEVNRQYFIGRTGNYDAIDERAETLEYVKLCIEEGLVFSYHSISKEWEAHKPYQPLCKSPTLREAYEAATS